MQCYLFAILLLQASSTFGRYTENGYYLVGPAVSETKAATATICFDSCSGNCVGASYNKNTQQCLKTECGDMILLIGELCWTTTIPGDPILVGTTLPDTTHDWPLTDRCGLRSYGANYAPTIISTSNVFNYQNGNVHGNALFFKNEGGDKMFGYTMPHASIKTLVDRDVSLSITCWAYLMNIPKETSFVEFWSVTGPSWAVWLYPNGTSIDGYIRTSAMANDFNINQPIQPKQWYHIAFVYDASAAKLDLHLNGAKIYSTFANSFNDKFSFDRLVIGGRLNDNRALLNGAISNVHLYNVALSAYQVQLDLSSTGLGKVRLVEKYP